MLCSVKYCALLNLDPSFLVVSQSVKILSFVKFRFVKF